DRKSLVGHFAEAKDVKAAGLTNDRLADPDLAVNLEAPGSELTRHIGGDTVCVFGPGHGRGRISSIRFDGRSSRASAGCVPSPNARRRVAASVTASGLRSFPRNRRPARSAA